MSATRKQHARNLVVCTALGAVLLPGTGLGGDINLAAGKTCRFLPRQDRSMTMELTDGKLDITPETLNFTACYPAPLLYFDLERVEPVGEVRIYCSQGRNAYYNDAFVVPTLELFAGRDWNAMDRISGYNPFPLLDLRWTNVAPRVIAFTNLQIAARYVVLVAGNTLCTRPAQFSEVEILRGNFPLSQAEKPRNRLTLERIWTDFASVSNVEPFDPSRATPHVAWAKPMAGPPIRALFIVGRGGERDVAEVLQRIPLQYDLLRTEDTSGGHPDKEPALNFILAQRFLQTLDGEYDLMVIGGTIFWLDLTPEVRTKILAKINAGTGLLYVNPYPPRFDADLKAVLNGLPSVPRESLLCPFDSAVLSAVPPDLVRRGSWGRGRVLALMLGDILLPPIWETRYGLSLAPAMKEMGGLPNRGELYYSLLIKCLRWAARRDSLASVSAVDVKQLGEGRLEIAITAANAGDESFRGSVQVEARDPDFQLDGRHSVPVTLPSGWTTNLTLSLPGDHPLRPGEHTVTVFLRDRGGNTCDWGSALAHGNRPGIAALDWTQTNGIWSQPVAGVVRADAAAGADTVDLRLTDPDGRLCARDTQPLTNGAAAFSLSTERVHGLAARLEARLLRAGKEIDRRTSLAPLGLNQPLPTTDYTWYRWPTVIGYIPWFRELLKLERQAGVDGGLFGPATAADAGLRAYHLPVYSLDYGMYGSSGPTPDQLLAETTRERLRQRLEAEVTRTAPWGVTDYSIGDETVMTDPQSPVMNASFQQALQQQYGTIAALNAEWGTGYGAFTNIPAPRVTEAYPEAFIKQGSLQPWFAYRQFLDRVFFAPVFEGVALTRQLAPGRRLGLDGINCLASTDTAWYELMQRTDSVIYYNSVPVDCHCVRSFARADQFVASWSGYEVGGRDELRAHWEAWKELLRGFNGTATFGGPGGFRESAEGAGETYRPFHAWGVYRNDLSVRRSGGIFAEQTREIKRGIGKLLLQARPIHEVAVHYSPESRLASIGVPGPWRPWGQCWWWHGQVTFELGMVTRLMDDLQYTWKFLAPPQLEAGELTPSRYKLFVMAMSVALSDREIAAVRKYVEDGGVLLVMGDCGLMTANGKFCAGRPLDTLLGIAGRKTLAISGPYAKARVAGFEQPLFWICDPQLEVKGGRVAAYFTDIQNADLESNSIPAIVVSAAGKGQTVYFNGYCFEYSWALPETTPGPKLDKHTLAERTARGYRAVMRELVKASQARPHLIAHDSLYPEPGMPYAEWSDFAAGAAHYYGVLEDHFRRYSYDVCATVADRANWRPVEFAFSARAHLYDIRAEKYLGYTDRARVPLGTCIAKVFAAMPYKIKGLQLAAPSAVKQGAQVKLDLAVLADRKPLENHVVNLEFFDPSRARVDAYSGPVLLSQGVAQPVFLLALDDALGRWKVVATEIVSGKSEAVEFRIEP